MQIKARTDENAKPLAAVVPDASPPASLKRQPEKAAKAKGGRSQSAPLKELPKAAANAKARKSTVDGDKPAEAHAKQTSSKPQNKRKQHEQSDSEEKHAAGNKGSQPKQKRAKKADKVQQPEPQQDEQQISRSKRKSWVLVLL